MRLTKKLGLGLMVLVLAIGMMPVSDTVVAEPDRTHHQASEEQVERLRELWGQDISLGEMLEQVFPEALEGRSKEQLELLYKIKMVWPDPKADQPQYPQYNIETRGALKSDVEPQVIYHVHHKSNMDTAWPWI